MIIPRPTSLQPLFKETDTISSSSEGESSNELAPSADAEKMASVRLQQGGMFAPAEVLQVLKGLPVAGSASQREKPRSFVTGSFLCSFRYCSFHYCSFRYCSFCSFWYCSVLCRFFCCTDNYAWRGHWHGFHHHIRDSIGVGVGGGGIAFTITTSASVPET